MTKSRWCPKCHGAKAPSADLCPACKITLDYTGGKA